MLASQGAPHLFPQSTLPETHEARPQSPEVLGGGGQESACWGEWSRPSSTSGPGSLRELASQPVSGRQLFLASVSLPLSFPVAPCMKRMPSGTRPTTGRGSARRWCSVPPGW